MTASVHGQASKRTHQVDIRDEVAEQGKRHTGGPHGVGGHLEDGSVEKPSRRTELAPVASRGCTLPVAGGERPVGEAGQEEDEHEHAQDPQRVGEVHAVREHPQQEGQQHREGAAPGGDHAVHQPEALLEVLSQDHQGGLVGEGAAAGEDDSVGEVQGLNGAARDGERGCPLLPSWARETETGKASFNQHTFYK